MERATERAFLATLTFCIISVSAQIIKFPILFQRINEGLKGKFDRLHFIKSVLRQ